ncbi:hypothetical protein ACUN9V_14665 [Salinicola sp. V024]|uniref:hypothetical protein n=1 Tax=Salinicola sp. V024 TaxID=3459609 RepID=UPI004044E922
MWEQLEGIVSNLGLEGFGTAIVTLALIYLVKKEPSKIFIHFHEQKHKNIDHLINISQSVDITQDSKEHIEEYIDGYIFKKIYRINACAGMRNSLFRFYKAHQSLIGWHNLRRAYPYLVQRKDSIDVKIRSKDVIWRWVVSAFSYLVGVYALLVFLVAFISLFDDKLRFLGLLGGGVLLLFAALIFSSLNWPYHSAIKIQRAKASRS